MVAPASHRVSVSRGTQDPAQLFQHVYRALTSLAGLPRPFDASSTVLNAVLQPQIVVNLVWAAPRSLATTNGIVSFPRAT